MIKNIFGGIAVLLLLVGAGCVKTSTLPQVQEAAPPVSEEAVVPEMPLEDSDAQYVLAPDYTFDPNSASYWNTEHAVNGFRLQYIKNNVVAQELPLRFGADVDNSTLYWLLGQEVFVRGEQRTEKVTENVVCVAAPCPPLERVETYILASSVQGSPRPFSLEDPTATYTLREKGDSGIWYVVYVRGNDLPRISHVNFPSTKGKTSIDPTVFKDKQVSIEGKFELSPEGSMYITPDKITLAE